jgi:hypothetical protein
MNYVMDTTWLGTAGAMTVAAVVIASCVFGCARRWRTARGITTLANPGLARADHRSPLSRSLQAAKFDSSFGTAREAWIDLRQSLWDSVSDDV